MNFNDEKKYAQMISETVFTSLDFETTGANPAFDRIIEVGIVKFKIGGEIERFESFVNPLIKIPMNVQQIHGIDDLMVKDAPHMKDVLPRIIKLIEGTEIVIQNPSFDLSFLSLALQREGKDVTDLEAFDTVKMARKILPDLKNHKLNTICDYFDISLDHHRALSDTVGCMKAFVGMLEIMDPNEKWRMRDLLRFHGNKVKSNLKRKIKPAAAFPGLVTGTEVLISYRDMKGVETSRKILPKEYLRYGNKKYLFAYCYLREEFRYFRTDGILEVSDVLKIT